MIRFACPGCSATFNVDDAKAGKPGKCPKCNTQFIIPEADPPALGVGAPPLPSQAPASDETVEISPCPKCSTQLTVSTGDVGLDVECPTCATVFKAVKPGRNSTPPAPPPAPPKRSALESTDSTGKPKSKRRDDDRDDDDDRPKSRRRKDDDDEDEDRPSRRGRRDDDEEDEDRPRRKKSRRRSRSAEPHRGVLILVLGILSWAVCIICGIVAFSMANNDLRKMDDGTMDEEGRTMTNIGKWLGLVHIVIFVIVIVLACVLGGIGGMKGK